VEMAKDVLRAGEECGATALLLLLLTLTAHQ
jgi:hypothetical protein